MKVIEHSGGIYLGLLLEGKNNEGNKCSYMLPTTIQNVIIYPGGARNGRLEKKL